MAWAQQDQRCLKHRSCCSSTDAGVSIRDGTNDVAPTLCHNVGVMGRVGLFCEVIDQVQWDSLIHKYKPPNLDGSVIISSHIRNMSQI